MPIMNRDGVDIHYDSQGDGPALLLTHGFCASSTMWQDNVTSLIKAGWRVITWDMRGHGRTGSPDDVARYSAELTVADMKALLDAADVDQAVIGGMSLGGYMSMAFHLAHTDRVRALMLIDTGPGFKNDAAREKWNDFARNRGDELEAKGDTALSSSSETRIQKQNWRGLRNAAHGMLTQQSADVISSLPGIKVPTLVIVGDRDEPYLVASEYMATRIPKGRKVVITDAGHAANMDQPEQFNAAALNFLNTL
jgi:pimeloyl-ACP methyl ester carboxylesterase